MSDFGEAFPRRALFRRGRGAMRLVKALAQDACLVHATSCSGRAMRSPLPPGIGSLDVRGLSHDPLLGTAINDRWVTRYR